MTDVSFSKIKSKTKKIRKPAREELEKFRTSISKQVLGDKGDSKNAPATSSKDQTSPIVEAMQASSSGSQKQSNDQKKQSLRKHKKTLEEVEADEKKAAQKRKELEEAAREIRDPKQEPEDQIVQPGEPILPASKPSRGSRPADVAARKSKKAETRLGKQ